MSLPVVLPRKVLVVNPETAIVQFPLVLFDCTHHAVGNGVGNCPPLSGYVGANRGKSTIVLGPWPGLCVNTLAVTADGIMSLQYSTRLSAGVSASAALSAATSIRYCPS